MRGELAKEEGEEEGFMQTKKKKKQEKQGFAATRELKLHPGSQAAPLVARSPAHKVLLFHF